MDDSNNTNNTDIWLPDWLKWSQNQEEIPHNNTSWNENIETENIQENTNYIQDTLKSWDWDLPNWLKWLDKNELNDEINLELDLENKDSIWLENKQVENVSELPSWLKWDSISEKIVNQETIKEPDSEKKKQPIKKSKEAFEDVSDQIKSPKPIAKKPKILEQKSDESILNNNTDELPDWLK